MDTVAVAEADTVVVEADMVVAEVVTVEGEGEEVVDLVVAYELVRTGTFPSSLSSKRISVRRYVDTISARCIV